MMRNPLRKVFFLFFNLFFLSGILNADIVTLKSRESFQGQVISFDGKSFNMEKDGKSEDISYINIASIVFEGNDTVTVQTKTDQFKAVLKKMEDSQLVYLDDQKMEKKIPLMMVNGFQKQVLSKIETISHGERVDLKDYIQDGMVVVFDFYSDWCGPCLVLGPKLENHIKKYDDVVLRKIDIVSWDSAVVKQHKIRSVPNVWVYDKKGQLVGQPTYSFSRIQKYIERARQ